MSDKVRINLGSVDLAGKGPGTYVGGSYKAWKDYQSDIKTSASHFLECAANCLNDGKIEDGKRLLLVPGVVCAAFSIELSYKLLLKMATSEEVKGHLFEELHKKLPPQIKERVALFSNDFDSFIKRNNNVFVYARYHHEENSFSFRESEILQFAKYIYGVAEALELETRQ
jgi:hypothetical protein